jgi:hypothetical protein
MEVDPKPREALHTIGKDQYSAEDAEGPHRNHGGDYKGYPGPEQNHTEKTGKGNAKIKDALQGIAAQENGNTEGNQKEHPHYEGDIQGDIPDHLINYFPIPGVLKFSTGKKTQDAIIFVIFFHY